MKFWINFLIIIIFTTGYSQENVVTQVKYKFIPAKTDERLANLRAKRDEFFKTEYALFSFNKKFAKYQNLGDPRLFNNNNYLIAQIYLGKTLIFDLENKTTYKFLLEPDPEFYFKVKSKNNNWVLTNQSKIINNITCYRALLRIEDWNTQKDGSKKQLIFNYEAWYSPDIPINVFYKELNGLPGLIMELSLENVGSLVAENIKYNVNVSNNFFKPDPNLYEREDYDEYITKTIELMNKARHK